MSVLRQEGFKNALRSSLFAARPQRYGIWLLERDVNFVVGEVVHSDVILLSQLRVRCSDLAAEFFRDQAHPEWN